MLSIIFYFIIRFNLILSDNDPLRKSCDHSKVITDTFEYNEYYDFIVIGSGSGGSVIANRLSEISNWTILLLEAGDQGNFLIDVPLTAALTHITRFNWGYKTERSKGACLGFKNGVCNWPKGRILGGTSCINFLVYQRGHARDYDRWSELGNVGWSYRDVLPYFKKSETVGISNYRNSTYRGCDGPVHIQESIFETPLLEAFLKTGQDYGYDRIDVNGDGLLGMSKVQATMCNGRRCNAANAYLEPIHDRKNLHISMKSWVTKILIDPETKQTFGVEFYKNKKKYRIFIRKEVILSAGTIASPQLLMLSGIGPKDHLTELGIEAIQDLKVGYNLQDHIGVTGLTFLVNRSITIIDRSVQNPRDIFNYFLRNSGPFTSPGGAEAYGFFKLPNSTLPIDYPDVELVMGVGALSGDTTGTLRNLLGVSDEFFYNTYKEIIGRHAFGIVPIALRPRSIGRLKLKSKNPFHWPKIDPNYLDGPYDLKTLIEGLKLAINFGQSIHFQQFGSKFYDGKFYGCDHFPDQSDEYWECCIRRYTSSLQHQVGTCKMGPITDPEAVVDAKLKVHGIGSLRVVDASIMPILPAAHTVSVVYMIGEKGADLIKEYWARN